MKTLEDLRKEIDIIDKELFNLLDKRFNISLEVGLIKAESGKVVLDNSREQQILDKIKDNNLITFKEQIINVYTEIMKNSKNLQNNLKADNGQNNQQ